MPNNLRLGSMNTLKEKRLWIASFIAVLVIYHISYGLETLIPTNVSWLMTAMHDWGTHYLGWLYYKNEPWTFPLGNIHGYLYPLGTNVGFTDSIPVFAIFFKLFSFILPADFQYFGLWLLLCHLLTVYYTIRFLKLFHLNDLVIFIAVLFVTANPVLIFRGLHPALCAHWLIMAPLYYYFKDPQLANPAKTLRAQFILLIISGLVNPYMCLLVMGFTLVIPFKLCFVNKIITKQRFFIYVPASFIGLLVSWLIVGMITLGGKEDIAVTGGYGIYGMNLNSLFNSSGFSTYLPALKQVSPHQYEGYMYLGLGMLLLMAVSLIYYIFLLIQRRSFKPRLVINNTNIAPLLALVIALTLFSVTHVVSLNEKVLFKAPVPSFLLKLGEVFRASGRFFWLSYYLLILFTIIGIARIKVNQVVKLSLLAIALVIQFMDTKLLLTFRKLSYGTYTPPINNKKWNDLLARFKDVALYPAFETNNLTSMDYQFFAYWTGRAAKPINTGYAARISNKGMESYKDSLKNLIDDSNLTEGTLYITTSANLGDFATALGSPAVYWNTLDNYYYAFIKNKDNAGLTQEKPDPAVVAKVDSILSDKVFFTSDVKPAVIEKESIHYSIDKMSDKAKKISINGYAFIESTQNNKGDSIFISLDGEGGFYTAPTGVIKRDDVTSFFQRTYLSDAGYKATVFKESVERGTYTLGLVIKDNKGKVVYQPTDKLIKVKISDYATPEKVYQLPATGDIKMNIEHIINTDSVSSITGWAYINNQSTAGRSITLLLKNGVEQYTLETDPVPRPDITDYFKSNYDLSHAGFKVRIKSKSLPTGKYQIGVWIKDKKNNNENIAMSDKQLEIL